MRFRQPVKDCLLQNTRFSCAAFLLILTLGAGGCVRDRVNFGNRTITGDRAYPVAAAKSYLRHNKTLRETCGPRPDYEGVTVTYETGPYRCTVSSRFDIDGSWATVDVELQPASLGNPRDWDVTHALLRIGGIEIELK